MPPEVPKPDTVQDDSPLLPVAIDAANGHLTPGATIPPSTLKSSDPQLTDLSSIARGLTDTEKDLRDPLVICHEIGNPLATIISAVELLGRNVSDSERNDLMRIIGESAGQIDKLLQRIQASVNPPFPDPTSPEETPDFRKIDLSYALRTQVDTLKMINESISITDDIAPDIFIRGDDVKLHQILSNILQNAVDIVHQYSKNPEIKVILRTAKDGLVQILIQDNGTGVSSENLKKIFERGVTGKDNREGHGIGLWLSGKLASEIGGVLTIVNNSEYISAETHGATAVIELPLYEGT